MEIPIPFNLKATFAPKTPRYGPRKYKLTKKTGMGRTMTTPDRARLTVSTLLAVRNTGNLKEQLC